MQMTLLFAKSVFQLDNLFKKLYVHETKSSK